MTLSDQLPESVIPESFEEGFLQYLWLIGERMRKWVQETIERDLGKIARDASKGEKELRIYETAVRVQVVQMLTGSLRPTFVGKKEAFQSMPRISVKLFQEIFTPPEARQVFSREEMASQGESELIGRCIVDPRRITDTILRNFGLDKYIPRKGTPREESIAIRAQAISEIKACFTNGFEPLMLEHETPRAAHRQRYFRLFRVLQGKNRGLILGVQENSGKRTFLTDLPSAYRRIDHIRQGYEEEIRSLERISYFMGQIVGEINRDGWKQVSTSGRLDAVTADITGIVSSLQHVRNDHKTVILNRLSQCISFEDKRGQLNPNSRLSLLWSSQDFIGKRIEEIGRISGFLAQDQNRVSVHMETEGNKVTGFCRVVEEKADELRVLKPETEIPIEKRGEIIRNLQGVRALCRSFRFVPYIEFANGMLQEIDMVVQVLENTPDDKKCRREAQRSFVRLYALAKLIRAERGVLQIRKDFFPPGQDLKRVFAVGVLQALRGVRDQLKARRLSTRVRVDDYMGPYVELDAKLREWMKLAGQATPRRLSEGERVAFLEEIRGGMKAFSLLQLERFQHLQASERK